MHGQAIAFQNGPQGKNRTRLVCHVPVYVFSSSSCVCFCGSMVVMIFRVKVIQYGSLVVIESARDLSLVVKRLKQRDDAQNTTRKGRDGRGLSKDAKYQPHRRDHAGPTRSPHP